MTFATAGMLSRRELILGIGAFFVGGRAPAAQPPRIAAIDWAMLETALALGMTPIAATELLQFRKDAVEPAIPDNVVDLGLRGSPNFELLHLLKPELILISPFYTRHQAALERIAPILSHSFYVRGEPPFEKSLQALTVLGKTLDRKRAAEIAFNEANAALEIGKQSLSRFAERPFYLVNVGDARHVRIFGSDSMFGDVLGRMGLRNAWNDKSRFTFAAPVPIERLSTESDAWIVVISEIPVEARSSLRNSMIWNSLEPIRRGRLIMLGNINPYGGVTAGLRFARLLRDELLTRGVSE